MGSDGGGAAGTGAAAGFGRASVDSTRLAAGAGVGFATGSVGLGFATGSVGLGDAFG